jgi:hypothetical protein
MNVWWSGILDIGGRIIIRADLNFVILLDRQYVYPEGLMIGINSTLGEKFPLWNTRKEINIMLARNLQSPLIVDLHGHSNMIIDPR